MIPEPLHPAVVHFPIVFILLGTFAIFVTFFIKSPQFLFIACGLLVLSAASAYFAEQTGSDSYGAFKSAFPQAENILDTHADNATWTVRFAFATAALSLLMVFFRNTKAKKVFHLCTIISSLILTYSMYNTAHLGGEMVYGDALELGTSRISETLEQSTHTHEGPDAHSH